MKNLSITEKYRPKNLAALRGHARIVAMLKSFTKKPCSKAFLFSGPAGTGKTSAAYAIAGELGCDFSATPKECGGVFELASGELTADNVREMFRTSLAYRPFYGSGWKVLIANEADNMSTQAQFVLLDILENLPPMTVVVFTTNDVEKLPARFRQRCESHVFKTPARGYEEPASAAELAAQALIDDVWRAELGHNHSPRLDELDGWKDGGMISFRAVLSALDPMIRAQRDIDAETLASAKAETAAMVPQVETPAETPAPRKRVKGGELMARIQIAITAGDFETARQLEAQAA